MKSKILALSGLVAFSGASFAAIPAAVTTAITDAGADGLTIVTALAVAGAVWLLLSKVLKRTGVSS
jgi:Inovirus Coat protein B